MAMQNSRAKVTVYAIAVLALALVGGWWLLTPPGQSVALSRALERLEAEPLVRVLPNGAVMKLARESTAEIMNRPNLCDLDLLELYAHTEDLPGARLSVLDMLVIKEDPRLLEGPPIVRCDDANLIAALLAERPRWGDFEHGLSNVVIQGGCDTAVVTIAQSLISHGETEYAEQLLRHAIEGRGADAIRAHTSLYLLSGDESHIAQLVRALDHPQRDMQIAALHGLVSCGVVGETGTQAYEQFILQNEAQTLARAIKEVRADLHVPGRP